MRFLVILAFLPFTVKVVWSQTLVVTELADLPASIHETSGLENGPNDWFWTHNDGGNPSEIHCIDTAGVIQRTVYISGDANTDWEDIAKDDQGNLYIGNFGNNGLNRTDLRIVKIANVDTCTVACAVSDTIEFTYPDQYDFPPNGDYGNFDMEAMLWYQDSLHLFSKDRSSPSTGYTKHYRLPSVGGTYQAELIDSFNTGSTSFINAITAADISADGQKVVLLNAESIWLITDFQGSDFFSGTVSQLSLGSLTQKEGICFRNGFIYLTDEREQFFGSGGNLYLLHPGVFVGLDERQAELQVEPIYRQDLTLEEIRIGSDYLEWNLLTADGRLLKSGKSKTRITANDLDVAAGIYVIQLVTASSQKAMLVRL